MSADRRAVRNTMLAPRRIIAPVAFAEDSNEAVDVATSLAAALAAELVLVGIEPSAVPEPLFDSPDVERLTRQVESRQLQDRLVTERLDELAAAMPRAIRVRTFRTSGPVGPALVAAARQHRADLIVVPIGREGEVAHLVHDHADRYILHHSAVPVLVVPTGVHESARADDTAG